MIRMMRHLFIIACLVSVLPSQAFSGVCVVSRGYKLISGIYGGNERVVSASCNGSSSPVFQYGVTPLGVYSDFVSNAELSCFPVSGNKLCNTIVPKFPSPELIDSFPDCPSDCSKDKCEPETDFTNLNVWMSAGALGNYPEYQCIDGCLNQVLDDGIGVCPKGDPEFEGQCLVSFRLRQTGESCQNNTIPHVPKGSPPCPEKLPSGWSCQSDGTLVPGGSSGTGGTGGSGGDGSGGTGGTGGDGSGTGGDGSGGTGGNGSGSGSGNGSGSGSGNGTGEGSGSGGDDGGGDNNQPPGTAPNTDSSFKPPDAPGSYSFNLPGPEQIMHKLDNILPHGCSPEAPRFVFNILGYQLVIDLAVFDTTMGIWRRLLTILLAIATISSCFALFRIHFVL